jgi:hypothetical protein
VEPEAKDKNALTIPSDSDPHTHRHKRDLLPLLSFSAFHLDRVNKPRLLNITGHHPLIFFTQPTFFSFTFFTISTAWRKWIL